MKNRISILTSILLSFGSASLLVSCQPKVDKEHTQGKKEWVLPADYPDGTLGEQVKYGEQLISDTAHYLGPDVEATNMRIAGNHLSCKNCHLQAGKQANAIGFVGVSHRYPKYRGREDKVASLAQRINGCFERSLNGKALPEASTEMQAILAYMNWLSEGIDGEVKGNGLPKLDFMTRAANPEAGKAIYTQQCSVCHGKEGQGVPKQPQKLSEGYTFPPLWGNDSYNDGAGMHRVNTAAQFIHANMPLGNAKLSEEEAYDVSAYINSQPRPHKTNREKDYPNLTKKPVDTPYGPYADSFSEQQHKYGPFGEMQKQ
jgi:thiosulfate dehydrogenase